MKRARWARKVMLAGILAATSAVAVVAQKSSSSASSPSMPVWFDTGAASPFAPGSSGTPSLLGGDNIPDLVVSPGTGSLATRVIDGVTLGELGSGFPFGPGFGASVLTAMGELSGDATADIAVAMGPGGGLVRLYNGATIAEIGSGYPFGAGFSGGVSLAVGDLNGDGRADIVTGQASGGGAVRVFSGTDYAMLLSQTPFGAGYTGGLNVAADDVDGDGRVEVIVAQATGGTVAVISGATQAVTASGAPYGFLPGGVFVAAADVNGDGRADVITAPGSGNSPILVYDINTLSPIASFAPYGTTAPGGVRVAATDLTGDGRADIITVPGPGREPELKIFSGATFALLSTQPAYPAIYAGGVFVSAVKARPGQPINPGPPGAPIGLDFTVLGGNVALRWSPPSTGGAPTNYRVDVGSDRGLSNLARLNVGNVTATVATAPTGVFFVRVVATNAWGEGPPSNEVVIVSTPTLGTGQFSATLSWDTVSDIDLHVIEPSGYHVYYRESKRRGPTTLLDADNTIAYGPENIFTDRPAAPGIYEVFVVPYAGDPSHWPVTARITIRTNVGTPAEDYRVFTRTFTGPRTTVGQNVATVTFPGGIITEVTGPRNVIYDLRGPTESERVMRSLEFPAVRWVMTILALSACSATGAQVGTSLIPSTSVTTWAPGVRGIPTRTKVCSTVNAATYGSGREEASAGIQAAINACPTGEVVRLSAGAFTVNNFVRIGKGITLRGAGAGTTILQKTNRGAEQEQILIVGPSRWPIIDEKTAVNLTADAVQGAMSVTVADSAGFAPGQFVKLDEDDYTTATWTGLPEKIAGDSVQVLATDRLVWPIKNPRSRGGLPLPGGLSWHSRPGRPLAEIKEVTAVDGNTITFSTPVHITYTTAKAAQLVRYSGAASTHVRDAGVEDLTLTGGSDGNLSFSSAAYSWAKNIECMQYGNPCVDIRHSFRLEIRDSYIHDAVHPYPGGAGYALSLQQGTSEVLIENNIIVGANKLIVARSAGAGSVVGYNYMDNAFIGNYPGWMEVGLNGSHMVGSHHMLFEGNLSFNYDSDDTWGGALAMTIFRNHLTGRRRDYPNQDNVRAVGLMFGSWWHTFVGNVLGEPGAMDDWIYEDPGDGTYGNATSKWGKRFTIWKLGYAPAAWDQGPDPKVRSTVVRDGNFDYLTNTVKWDHEPQPLPPSLYLTAKPAFFGALPWPWVDPTGTVKVRTLPAHARFESLMR